MMNGYGFGAGWMMLMPLFWVALLGLAVWAVIALSRGWSNRGPGRVAGPDTGETWRETPREVLDRRLAAGEIDTAAYDEALARLSGQRTTPAH